MQITYMQTTEELRQRFLPSSSWRQRLKFLWITTWPVLLCVAACITGSGRKWSAIILDVTGIIYGVLFLMMAAAWVLELWAARTNESVSCLAEISECEFFLKVIDGAEWRYPWTHFGEIIDLGDYLMFDNERGQHLAVVPKSAFGTSEQAQDFFVQSHQYWSAAKRKQQDAAEQSAGVWPPAPRPGG